MIRKWSPSKGVALTSLCHGDQRVGDRSADIGAHDDGNSELDREHCQGKVSFIVSSTSQLQDHICLGRADARTHIQRRPC